MIGILSMTIFSPLLVLLFLLFIKKENERMIKTIGTLGTLPPLGLVLFMTVKGIQGESLSIYHEHLEWIQFAGGKTIGYDLAIDGLSISLLLLSSIIFALAGFLSWHIPKEWKGYYSLFLLLEMGTLGVFCSDNLLLFFLFFEITFVSLFFLIGKWGEAGKERASFRFLLYNGIGSVLLFIAIAGLFAKMGTLQFAELEYWLLITENGPFKTFLFLCLVVAFGIKLPAVPFHQWMVQVHKEAHPIVVMIHSGVLLKIGAYGFIRMAIGFFPEEWAQLGFLVIILGIVNILYGASFAFIQKDLRGVWAYSSVSHMGFILIGLGALNPIGLQGAIFQAISHGLIAALLFLILLPLVDKTGTTELERLGGFASISPNWAGLLLVGGMAVLGLPGTSGFIAEVTVIIGLFERESVLASIACLGLVLAACYSLRAVLKTSFGPKGTFKANGFGSMKNLEEERSDMKLPSGVSARKWSYGLPASILVFFIITLGLYPDLILSLIKETVEKTMMAFGG